MSAIKKILKRTHLDVPELVDYQVRIPRGGKTNALTEAIITWQVKGKRLQTIGIDSDQVISAVNATLKMLNLQLLQKKIAER
jgi:D-citramalate synthase